MLSPFYVYVVELVSFHLKKSRLMNISDNKNARYNKLAWQLTDFRKAPLPLYTAPCDLLPCLCSMFNPLSTLIHKIIHNEHSQFFLYGI